MPSNAVFLDANVLIEVILERGQQTVAKSFLSAHSSNTYISALTAHLAVHFGSKRVELPVMREFLGDYTILPLEAGDFEWAFQNARNADFEDALQLGVAIRHGCKRFVTFDQALYRAYRELPTISVELITG